MARFLKKKVYLEGLDTFKKNILEGQGFRGGSDQKRRRMWLGREIVVPGLPPLGKVCMLVAHKSL